MRGYALDNEAGSAAVRQIAKMSITGNVIPMSWFDHLRYPSGKPHLNAIIILSDIVYWYRPVEVRDEHTGRWLEDRKKFEGEYLQRNRSSYAKQYGLTNKQAKDAFHFLESKGAIEIIIAKSMTTKDGRRLGNVPFIALNAEKIAEFNEPLVHTGPRLGTYKSEPLVPTGPTNTGITVTETFNTEEETHIHVEKPNAGFSRVSPEHPQAQQPSLSLDGLSVPIAENENDSQHEKAKKPRTKKAPTGNPNTQPILSAYQQAYEAHTGFSYTFPGFDKKAAKTLADAGYTPDQVVTAYKDLCSDPWWSKRNNISLVNVSTEIGGILKKLGYSPSRDGSSVPYQAPKPNYLNPDTLYS